MAKKDTTITDKPEFSVKIIDQSKFNELDADNKEIFEILRNSMLEIIPTDTKGKHIEEAIRYAENFAFIGIKTFDKFFEKKIKSEIEALKNELSASIKAAQTTTTAQTTP